MRAGRHRSKRGRDGRGCTRLVDERRTEKTHEHRGVRKALSRDMREGCDPIRRQIHACIDNVLLCSNIQFVTTIFSSNQQHIEEVINIIKKRESSNINMIKLPLLNHIQVKRVRTRKELDEMNDYVSALSLI